MGECLDWDENHDVETDYDGMAEDFLNDNGEEEEEGETVGVACMLLMFTDEQELEKLYQLFTEFQTFGYYPLDVDQEKDKEALQKVLDLFSEDNERERIELCVKDE